MRLEKTKRSESKRIFNVVILKKEVYLVKEKNSYWVQQLYHTKIMQTHFNNPENLEHSKKDQTYDRFKFCILKQ